MEQTISISPTGSISSLRRKDGLDLRQLGKVEIQRVSEIKFNYETQMWYIEIISGPMKGLHPGAIYQEYEDAVAAEIKFLDKQRKQGIF